MFLAYSSRVSAEAGWLARRRCALDEREESPHSLAADADAADAGADAVSDSD